MFGFPAYLLNRASTLGGGQNDHDPCTGGMLQGAGNIRTGDWLDWCHRGN